MEEELCSHVVRNAMSKNSACTTHIIIQCSVSEFQVRTKSVA